MTPCPPKQEALQRAMLGASTAVLLCTACSSGGRVGSTPYDALATDERAPTLSAAPPVAAAQATASTTAPPLDPTPSASATRTPAATHPAYPGYPGPPTVDPTTQPRLHASVEGLPPGAVLRREVAQRWWPPDGVDAEMVHAVPLETADGPDLAVVFSDPSRSMAGWTFQRHASPDSGDPISSLEPVQGLGDDLGLIARRASGTSLWVLAMRPSARPSSAPAAPPAEVYVRARLPLVDSSVQPYAHGVDVWFADWSADGTDEVLLQLRSPAGTSLDLYALGDDISYEHVIRFDDPDAPILDFDGDGTLEYVDQREDGTWDAVRWNGTAAVRDEDAGAQLAPHPVTAGALPPIPADLYAKRFTGSAEDILHWPPRGGSLVEVAPADIEGKPLRWRGRMDPASTWTDVSADGRFRVEHERSAADHDPRLTVPDGDVPAAAEPEGLVFIEDRTRATQRQPLVRTYRLEQGDYGERHFEALALSPAGGALAWADGIGLWVARLPDGPPRLLIEHAEANPYGPTGIHRPRAWSPDERYLLGEVGYIEGGSGTLWDVDGGHGAVLENTFSYAAGHSELRWLSDSSGLIHLRSGGDPHGPLVSLIPPTDPGAVTVLVTGWPQAEGSVLHRAPHVFGAIDLGDGTIGFGMQSQVGVDPRTNGVFRVGRDGSNLERIAPLPPLSDNHAGEGLLHWSPDGTAFLFEGIEPRTHEPRLLVGDPASGGLWEATAVLRDAAAFAFDQ